MLTLPSDQNASGRSLGTDELDALKEVLAGGILTCTKGTQVRQFEVEFARRLGATEAIACSSGTAAIHAALSCVEFAPGDEVITTPVTDMGAITPILYQGAIPAFADIDPRDCNVTPRTIEDRLSARTKAIIATHLFGSPCEMPSIHALARRHGIFLIEDCAQAFLALSQGQPVGTFGDVGCFSLQQGKHITCGEGGIVLAKEPRIAQRLRMFLNKGWGRLDEESDHHVIGLNYKMNELSGAVSLAQSRRLEAFVEARRHAARALTSRLSDRPDVEPPVEREGDRHVFWRYAFRMRHGASVTASALAHLLRLEGINASVERYVSVPAFRRRIFKDRKGIAGGFPFTHAREGALDYSDGRFPGVLEAIRRTVVLPWNEKYTVEHADQVATAIARALA